MLEISSSPSRSEHTSLSHVIIGNAGLVKGDSVCVQLMDREAPYSRGLRAVQFHLFATCVLFLSRQGFCRACMRADIKCDGTSMEENVARLMKVAWLALPLGVLITVAACFFVFWWQELCYSNPYGQAILINGFACILELLAEPLYILSQNLLLLKLRLVVETIATLLRCVTMCFFIVKQMNMVRI